MATVLTVAMPFGRCHPRRHAHLSHRRDRLARQAPTLPAASAGAVAGSDKQAGNADHDTNTDAGPPARPYSLGQPSDRPRPHESTLKPRPGIPSGLVAWPGKGSRFASQPAGRACPLPPAPGRAGVDLDLRDHGGRDKYMTVGTPVATPQPSPPGDSPGGLAAGWCGTCGAYIRSCSLPVLVE